MRRFLINVNGKSYDVAVEEVNASAQQQTMAPAAPAPAAQAEAPAAPVQASTVVPEGTKIEAPMPGNIIEIKVAVGDEVKEGDVVMIMEAMKLENELLAPCSGKILSINTTKGSVVNTGDTLGVVG